MAIEPLKVENRFGGVTFTDDREAPQGSDAVASVRVGIEEDSELLTAEDLARIHAWTGALLADLMKT